MYWKQQELDRLHRQERETEARRARQARHVGQITIRETSDDAQTGAGRLFIVAARHLNRVRQTLRDERNAMDAPKASGATG